MKKRRPVTVDGRQPSERAEPGAAGSTGQRGSWRGALNCVVIQVRNIIYEIMGFFDDPFTNNKMLSPNKRLSHLFYFEGNNFLFQAHGNVISSF